MKDLVALNRRYHKDILHIDWFVGKRCNFDCVYCSPAIHDNFSPHISLENMIDTCDILLDSYPPDKIKIGFTGGEPTVNPNFLNFCKYLSKKNISKITVTTNGTRTAKYYIELLSYVDYLTISQHFGQSLSSNIFMERIKEITKTDDSFIVQVMAHAEHFDEVKKCVEFYKDNNIKFTVRKIRLEQHSSHNASNYSQEYISWIIKNQEEHSFYEDTKVFYKEDTKIKTKDVHVNEISGKDMNLFKGWKCWAGILHLHIDVSGTVYRGNCKVGGSLGNINDKTFVFPKNPVICTEEKCRCAPEISVKKVKEEKYKKYL
jgi:MoaA/NifB/PqqE/SkfB family radical SAM enzyme